MHGEICRAAAEAVPEEMAAWRAYGDLLGRYSVFPDVWKEADAAEGPRHYIDLERFGGLAATDLPADRSRLRGISARSIVTEDGLLPWVIMDIERRLTSAMASNEWTEAAALATALGHYVGDLHQPLHTTEHYDGQKSPIGGVHLRWEEHMPARHWTSSLMEPDPGVYLPDPWDSVRRWVAQSHSQYEAIHEADREAAAASGNNYESEAYFGRLWDRTKDILVPQVNRAATDLSSLWYTAWVNAGRPAIPPPPNSLPAGSIWAAAPPRAPAPAWTYGLAFLFIALLILFLSVRGKRSV